MPEVPELSPSQFRDRWENGGSGSAVLLDVREPAELAIARVETAVHIPMRDVPARLGELDSAQPIVVMCHSGVRSRRVAEYLAAQGFKEVYNLAGGVDAWSREVDADVPRY